MKYKELNVKHPIKKKRYWVTTNGSVYRKDKNGAYLAMKPFTTRDGYIEYVLTRVDGSKQHIQAQIITLATYKGYPKDSRKSQVNHIDGDRGNNNINNLTWVTPSENIRHSFDTLGKTVWNSPKRKI